MKWLKHMTATWDDERIAQLVDKGGMEGLAMYGLYWRVQEIIAARMEGKIPSCSAHYTVTRWSLLLSLRGSLVFSMLTKLASTGLVSVIRSGNDVVVTNRNLLKYRDEYSRKSGQDQDNVPPRTEGEGEGEGNKEADKYSSPKKSTSAGANGALSIAEQEEVIYKTYCRHVGKDAALKAIRKAVEKLSRANGKHPAMDAYEARKMLWRKAKEYSASPAGAKPPKGADDYRPHPATWFNQGKYLDDVGEWQKPNGGNHAAVSNGKADGNLAVLAESINRRKHQGSPHEDGLFSSSENRQDDARTIPGIPSAVGPTSVSSSDGNDF